MTQLATQPLDQVKSDEFGAKMLQMLVTATVAPMVGIGHRTGLFDTMADMPPATSAEIAAQADLNERYVREWLGAMVTSRIVDYDPDARTYHLPPEHAAWLTRAAVPQNLASAMQWSGVLASVEDRVIECFRHGGGVDYCHYHRFHDVMADESAQTIVYGLVEHILPLVPGLTDRLAAGIDVLDIGCGLGRAAIRMAEAFPNSRFTGYDLCEDAIAGARAEAAHRGLRNIRFAVRDAARLADSACYDLVTGFDVVHDQAHPAEVLANVHAALRPGGVFLMQDIAASSHVERNIDNPLGAMFYSISAMHCMSVSLAQNGAGLGTAWGEELALEMLAAAGFGNVRVERLPHDIQNNYYLMTKD